MKRIIMMVLRNILLVPWMWAKLCYHASHVDKYTEEEHYRMLQFITHRANKGGNVTIDAHGLENIPKENGFMFFPNHQGLYDVLSLVDVCPKPFSVVAKKEVENVPFLKQVFKCMKAYMMDRNDIRQSLQVIVNVTNEVKNGRNYLIFPEGTRNRNESELDLLPFHEGSFKIATKAGCPIVPIAIHNSAGIFEAQFPKMRPAKVIVEYGEPIYPDKLDKEEKRHIGAYTQNVILEMLKEMNQ